jgi:hypothetical protein
MATPIFYLNIRAQDITAEIRLNDAPMFRVQREHPQTALPTISEWVIVGDNQLDLHVYELGTAPRIRVALCQALLNDVPEPGNELELALIEWPPLPIPGAPPLALPSDPFALQAIGVARHRWPRWAWQDAPPFAPDVHTTTAVTAWVRDLHATLAAGSVDALIAHSQVKFKEVAPAYELTVAEAETRIRNAWAGLTSETRWELAPFDEANLDFRLHCGGRIVEPTTLAGEPILRQARPIDDEQWSLPIFIARTNWDVIAGQLTIVR